MADNQLKIWFGNFTRFYKKASFLTRIIICAAISLIFAVFMNKKVISPQKEAIKNLEKKAASAQINDDINSKIAEIREKQHKTFLAVEKLKQTNIALGKVYGTLNKTEIGKNIIELRKLINDNDLRILSEERLNNGKSGSNYEEQQSATHINIKFPSCFAEEGYRFELLGTYLNLRQFLIDVYASNSLFFVNNIKISETQEFITDENLHQHQLLKCSFEVHIPYLKTSK